ncbi:MAG: hypothetical protein PHT69_05380 [Bacteroidales bacterium]|nr:hypothetical protein [Bacteroidales bacterium]
MIKKIFKRIAYTLTLLYFPVIKVKMIRSYPGLRFPKGFRISTSTFIDHPQNLEIGENVYIGHHCFIEASNGITIGEGCQLTNYVNITTHSSHNSIRYYGKHNTEKKPKGYVQGPIVIG